MNGKNPTCMIGTFDSEINDSIPAHDGIKYFESLLVIFSAQRIINCFWFLSAVFISKLIKSSGDAKESGKGGFGLFGLKKTGS